MALQETLESAGSTVKFWQNLRSVRSVKCYLSCALYSVLLHVLGHVSILDNRLAFSHCGKLARKREKWLGTCKIRN